MERKQKTILAIIMFSLMALIISLGALRQTQNVGLKTPKEWVMMAVEDEHYQLDDDGYLLTHTATVQTPSLELIEEAEGKRYGDYLYVKDDNYYMAFFRHYLIVESYNNIEEYVYISAIAWEGRGIMKPKESGIHQWQIQDLDIEEVK